MAKRKIRDLLVTKEDVSTFLLALTFLRTNKFYDKLDDEIKVKIGFWIARFHVIENDFKQNLIFDDVL